jgi:hypothetical protein
VLRQNFEDRSAVFQRGYVLRIQVGQLKGLVDEVLEYAKGFSTYT